MSICVICVGWINLAQVGDPVFPDAEDFDSVDGENNGFCDLKDRDEDDGGLDDRLGYDAL